MSSGTVIAETTAHAGRYTSLTAFERCVAHAAELFRPIGPLSALHVRSQ